MKKLLILSILACCTIGLFSCKKNPISSLVESQPGSSEVTENVSSENEPNSSETTEPVSSEPVASEPESSSSSSSEDVKTWTVTFMLDSTTVYKTVTVQHNRYLTETITEPTLNNHTFSGWYADELCTVYVDETADPVTSDVTYYAGWVESGITNPDTPGENSGNSGETSEPDSSEGIVNQLPGTTDAPTEGYAIVINGTNYVALTHNPNYMGDGQEWYVLGLTLEEGYELSMYDGTNATGWIIKTPDPYSSGSWTAGTETTGIICGTSGTYDVYCKMIYQNDNIYFGKAA